MGRDPGRPRSSVCLGRALRVRPARAGRARSLRHALSLAGIILGVSGKRGHYLYAGSTTEGRELMPNYGLQWEAMRLLRDRGRVVHYSGCWDFPVDARNYERMAIAENMGLS